MARRSDARRVAARLLKKGLWAALYGGFSAVATIAARRAASQVWRHYVGEEPPIKK